MVYVTLKWTLILTVFACATKQLSKCILLEVVVAYHSRAAVFSASAPPLECEVISNPSPIVQSSAIFDICAYRI